MKFKNILLIAIGIRLILLTGCTNQSEYHAEAKTTSDMQIQIHDHRQIPFYTITGEKTSLADFDGDVILIVNTASNCGFTKQYVGLEELYRNKKDDGLVVIAFPANNFGGQEPGSNEEIQKFCQGTFDVTFPMMAKIDVTGEDMHPLFKYLTEDSPIPGKIKWNFNKFLLDRGGNLIARYDSQVEPDDKELVEKIEEIL